MVYRSFASSLPIFRWMVPRTPSSAGSGRYSLSTRCSFRSGRNLVRSQSLRSTLLLSLELCTQWPKSKEYHNTIPEILRESLHSHTNAHRHKLSVHPRRKASRILSSWRSLLRTTKISRDHSKNCSALKFAVWQFVTLHKQNYVR
jgi:hypothetical protein